MTSPATLLTPGFQAQLAAGESGSEQPAESAQAQGIPLFPEFLLFAVEAMADQAAPQPGAFGFGLPGIHSAEQSTGVRSTGEAGGIDAAFADEVAVDQTDAPVAPQPAALGGGIYSAEQSAGEPSTGGVSQLDAAFTDDAAVSHADTQAAPGAAAVLTWPQPQTIQSLALQTANAAQPEPDLAGQPRAAQTTGNGLKPDGADAPPPPAGNPAGDAFAGLMPETGARRMMDQPEIFGPDRAQAGLRPGTAAPAGPMSAGSFEQPCAPNRWPFEGGEPAVTAGGDGPAVTPDQPELVKGEHPPAGEGRIAQTSSERSGAARAGFEEEPVEPEPDSHTVLLEHPVQRTVSPKEATVGDRRQVTNVVEEHESARLSPALDAVPAAAVSAPVQSAAPAPAQSEALSPALSTASAPLPLQPAADAVSSGEREYGTPGFPLPPRAAGAKPARNSAAELAFEGRVIPESSSSSSRPGVSVRMEPEMRVREDQRSSASAVLLENTGKSLALEPEAFANGDPRRDADERRAPQPNGSPSPGSTQSSELAGKEPAAVPAPPGPAAQQAAQENRAPVSLNVDVAERRLAFHSATPARPAGEPVRAERPLEPGPEPGAARGPVRDITLKLEGENRVEVRLMERRGEVHFTVRTPDPQLAGDLRRDLPSLATRFHEAGLRGEAWHPSSAATERQDAALPGPSTGTPQQQAGEGEQRRRQDEPPEQSRGESNPRTKDNGKEFSWFLQSMA